MEYEIRFYYPKKQLDNILEKLKKQNNLENSGRYYEKTMQFDHPSESMSFYNKEIDGRFRIRVSKNNDESKCKISWKRRIKNIETPDINKEEEVELTIKYEEYNNLMFLVSNVLHMKDIESYERYRNIFENEEVEIAVDEYPFGIALEVESKKDTETPEKVIKEWLEKLNLDINDKYKLSWDDKYQELCQEQNVESFNHVLFDKPMPEVKE